MRFATSLRVGPIAFRIGSDWRRPIVELEALYRDYPGAADGVPDFTVRLEASRPWRRWLRPKIEIAGDHMLPEASPLPLRHALLAAEMAMNLQVALGERRFLLLHASVVERDGRALVMTGVSGAGKSTLAMLLAAAGWRFMGDEFALLSPETGLLHPFPRPISLKNESVDAAAGAWPEARLGPILTGTPKGTIRHMVPNREALFAMDRPATPALLLFPRYGATRERRTVLPAEAFVRLTQASTNYVTLAERGFEALTSLVRRVPAMAIDYPDGASGVAAVEAAWREL